MKVFIVKIIDDYENDIVGICDSLEGAKDLAFNRLHEYDCPILEIYETIVNDDNSFKLVLCEEYES